MNSIEYQIVGETLIDQGTNYANFLAKNHEVNSSSLGRVFQHIKKEKFSSWGIVTAYRDANSPGKNKSLFSALKSDVRSFGHGFFVVQGVGQEEDGGESKEPALFIPGISKKQIQKLSDKYNQYGYLYSGPETSDKIHLVAKDGETNIGSFQPMKIAQFYSKIKGKPFVFSEVSPNSHIERYAKSLNS